MAAYNSHGSSPSPGQYYPTLSYNPSPNSSQWSPASQPPPQTSPRRLPGPTVLGFLSERHSDPPPSTFDSWAAELQSGAELQAEILAREGYTCLYRPEYQFSNNCATASTPFSSQEAIYPSPLSTGSPLYSDPPGSTPSHDGSNMPPSIDTGPIKKFKCPQGGCLYASSRQDHVRYHFKAHHQGNRFECDKCDSKYTYKGDFDGHPCKALGKELSTRCTRCGSIINRKGLKRHQQTPKCNNNQIAR